MKNVYALKRSLAWALGSLLGASAMGCSALSEDAASGASNIDEGGGSASKLDLWDYKVTALTGNRVSWGGLDWEWFAEFYDVDLNNTSNALVKIDSPNHAGRDFYGVQIFKQKNQSGLAATLLLEGVDQARIDKYLQKKKDAGAGGPPPFGGGLPDDDGDTPSPDNVAALKIINKGGDVGPVIGSVDGLTTATLSGSMCRGRTYMNDAACTAIVGGLGGKYKKYSSFGGGRNVLARAGSQSGNGVQKSGLRKLPAPSQLGTRPRDLHRQEHWKALSRRRFREVEQRVPDDLASVFETGHCE